MVCYSRKCMGQPGGVSGFCVLGTKTNWHESCKVSSAANENLLPFYVTGVLGLPRVKAGMQLAFVCSVLALVASLLEKEVNTYCPELHLQAIVLTIVSI